MSGHNWESGAVALIKTTANRGVSCAAVRTVDGYWRCQHITAVDADVIEARPLVAIDPEDREQRLRLARAFLAVEHEPLADWEKGLLAGDAELIQTSDRLAAALREFATPTPPKPDEPQGLGAVVVDANGYHWVRIYAPTGGQWQYLGVRRVYADVDAVEVLSEGVAQ